MESTISLTSYSSERPIKHVHEGTERGAATLVQTWEQRRGELQKARTVPVLGFSALAGSTLTVFLSLAILLSIDGKPVWPNTGWYKLMQPASWLSALLSLNGILINGALAEGLTVAWWFQANKKDATIEKLHHTWATGTSALQAVRSWKHISYVSIAALFVALVPLNGFMLQGAITTPVAPVTTNSTIQVPMVKSLSLGYSGGGTPTDDYWTTSINYPFTAVARQIQFQGWGQFAKYAYFGSRSSYRNQRYDLGYNNKGPYLARVNGTGFNMTCVKSYVPYNFNTTTDRPAITSVIFSSDINWSPKEPNTMHFDLAVKRSENCTGYLEIKNCTLEAAIVEYPVQIQMNVTGTAYVGPFYSLVDGTTRNDDRVVQTLPPAEGDCITNSTYGGLANEFSSEFYGYHEVTQYLNGTGNSYTDGPLQSLIGSTYGDDYAECSLSYETGLDAIGGYQALERKGIDVNVEYGEYNVDTGADIPELIFSRIRRMMFLASVTSGSEALTSVFDDDFSRPTDRAHYVQNVLASQTLLVAKYRVRLYLWAISVILTWMTVGFVMPLFYGYWTLSRQTSMSPVDMARAFHAPILNQVDEFKDSKELLKEVGAKNVHVDLLPTATEDAAGSFKDGRATVTVQELKV